MRRVLSLALLGLALAGCAKAAPSDIEETTEPDPASLEIEAGAGLTDTISALPAPYLIVRVLASDGTPIGGSRVDFRRVTGAVEVDAGGIFAGDGHASTDAEGRARIRFRFGTLPGPASVAVTLSDSSGQVIPSDTARYTVLAGRPALFRVLPADTFAAPGSSYDVPGPIFDRAGNALSDAATFTAANTSVATISGRRVRTVASGVTWIFATVSFEGATRTDSARIIVMPVDLLATTQNGVVVEDVFGRRVGTVPGDQPTWSPNQQRMAFERSQGLYVAERDGTGAIRLDTPGIRELNWPEFTVDGAWIYFNGIASTIQQIYRIRPDGTGLTLVSSPGEGSAQMPTTSPDGSKLVYSRKVNNAIPGSGLVLREADGSTRTLTTVPLQSPTWSPDGAWIAAVRESGSQPVLIRPDGTGLHDIWSTGVYWGISWSSDSAWIVAYVNGEVAFIHLESGTVLRFPRQQHSDLPTTAWWR